AWIVPGVSIPSLADAAVVVLIVGALNALLPPLIAALRLPFTALLGFGLVLVLDALILMLASSLDNNTIQVDSFGAAILMSIVAPAACPAIQAGFGLDDNDNYSLRVTQRIAKRTGKRIETDVPGIVFLEIDGLALPVLQLAVRDGSAPTIGR